MYYAIFIDRFNTPYRKIKEFHNDAQTTRFFTRVLLADRLKFASVIELVSNLLTVQLVFFTN
jgi:hypothetical protein